MTEPETEQAPGRIAVLVGRVSGGRLVLPSSSAMRGSETAKAAGLAVAMIANNVIALGSTLVFTRLLSDYGSLAALVSYFLILSVVGQALQVATAREGVLGHLGVGAGLAATVRRWTIQLLAFTVFLAVVSIVLRDPIASAVGVQHDRWAAAIGLPAAGLWLELSILRGILQGVGDYKGVGISLVGEQAARLVTGAALAGAGLGVTGAYLGTPLSFIAMGGYCLIRLRRHINLSETGALSANGELPAVAQAPPTTPGLWTHVHRAWAPIAGLIVIAVLQNIDIIAAKHRFTTAMASSYGATAVAAKVLIWVAMGAGFYLVPEVSRLRAAGKDTRPVLFRALAIVGVCAVPVLLIFAVAPHLLLKVAFTAKKATASDALLVLGAAFTVLAATYLAIQYMLALKRTGFLLVVGVVAVAEPILLLNAPRHPAGFAAVVLGIQTVGAILAFGLALRRDRAIPPQQSPTAPRPSTADGSEQPELVGGARLSRLTGP